MLSVAAKNRQMSQSDSFWAEEAHGDGSVESARSLMKQNMESVDVDSFLNRLTESERSVGNDGGRVNRPVLDSSLSSSTSMEAVAEDEVEGGPDSSSEWGDKKSSLWEACKLDQPQLPSSQRDSLSLLQLPVAHDPEVAQHYKGEGAVASPVSSLLPPIVTPQAGSTKVVESVTVKSPLPTLSSLDRAVDIATSSSRTKGGFDQPDTASASRTISTQSEAPAMASRPDVQQSTMVHAVDWLKNNMDKVRFSQQCML